MENNVDSDTSNENIAKKLASKITSPKFNQANFYKNQKQDMEGDLSNQRQTNLVNITDMSDLFSPREEENNQVVKNYSFFRKNAIVGKGYSKSKSNDFQRANKYDQEYGLDKDLEIGGDIGENCDEDQDCAVEVIDIAESSQPLQNSSKVLGIFQKEECKVQTSSRLLKKIEENSSKNRDKIQESMQELIVRIY